MYDLIVIGVHAIGDIFLHPTVSEALREAILGVQ
jgi:hypothetical protein